MNEQTPQNEKQEREPRDAEFWAQRVERLEVSEVPEGALNLNVEGRRVVGPLQGFGKMWQKTYKVRLKGASVTPAEVVKTWKEHFPKFWPEGTLFHTPLAGIVPGEVALLGSDRPGSRWMATGVMVLYADEESFTYICPEGHLFSGWITFSAYEENCVTVAQVQALIRANDPLYELMMPLVLHKVEDRTWQRTLRNLAAHFGLVGQVEMNRVCADPERQWQHYKNIRHNAILHSMFHAGTAPIRRIRNSRKERS